MNNLAMYLYLVFIPFVSNYLILANVTLIFAFCMVFLIDKSSSNEKHTFMANIVRLLLIFVFLLGILPDKNQLIKIFPRINFSTQEGYKK